MQKSIYVTEPTLPSLQEVMSLLEGVWERGILTHNGPLVQQFEKDIQEQFQAPHTAIVSNGTIALQMAIRALELKGEIITTPFTFIATLNSIIWEYCTPVFADINPDTLNIDPLKISEKITKKTVAILPVHVFGNPCDIETIQNIADQNQLKVIYDAAHAIGVKYNGKSIFHYGDISTTSFHATKLLNTGEGGACFTTDARTIKRLKQIRFFGFDENKEIVCNGFNGKMTEIHAAIGLANLKLIKQTLTDREEKYKTYKKILSSSSEINFQKINQDCNYSYFPVILPSEDILLKVESSLNSQNIFPRRYFYPSVNTFKAIVPHSPMPISEDISRRILCLPLFYNLPNEMITEISKIVLSTI